MLHLKNKRKQKSSSSSKKSVSIQTASLALSLIFFALINQFLITDEDVQHDVYVKEKHHDPPGIIRVPMYEVKRSNSRHLAKEDAESVSENKDSQGTHFVKLFVGNPAQERTLTVNTNTPHTAFPCNDCLDCGDTTPFDQDTSVTFDVLKCTGGKCMKESHCTQNQCIFRETYSDFSTYEAYEVEDFAYIGGGGVTEPVGTDAAQVHGFKMRFGCEKMSRGWYTAHANDGMLGMSYGENSFISQMYENEKLAGQAFAMCFSAKSQTFGSSAGALTLGGFDMKYHSTPMVFTQNSPGDGFSIHLKRIYMRKGGGSSVRPENIGMTVVRVDFDDEEANGEVGIPLDSAKPNSRLPKIIEEPFRRVWKTITGTEYSYGRLRLLDGDLSRLPTLLFQFKASLDVDYAVDPFSVLGMVGDLDPAAPYDIIIAVPANHYMAYNPVTGYYRSHINFASSGTYIGSNLMYGHDIMFDFERNRIGIAEVTKCVPKIKGPVTADDDVFETPFEVRDDDSVWRENNEGNDDTSIQRGGNTPLGPGSAISVTSFGSCKSMVCRLFVATGYVALLVFAFVIFKCARIKRAAGEYEFDAEDITSPLYSYDESHRDHDNFNEEQNAANSSDRVFV